MADFLDWDDFMRTLVQGIQRHIDWHREHNSTATIQGLRDIVYDLEAEKLDHLTDKYDREGEESLAHGFGVIKRYLLSDIVQGCH